MEAFCADAERELSTISSEDVIHECGSANMQLLHREPSAALEAADAKLRVFPFKDVKTCWRRLYTEASLLKALWTVQEALFGPESLLAPTNGTLNPNAEEDAPSGPREKRTASEADANHEARKDDPKWLTETVRLLDMALIMTGGCGREDLIERLFVHLEQCIEEAPHQSPSRAYKRVKRSMDFMHEVPATFPPRSLRLPEIEYPVKRSTMTLSSFQVHLDSKSPSPLVLRGVMDHWSAEKRHMWSSPTYLLDKTLGGCRLVPVELGRSYTDDDWGQKIMPFGNFMEEYLLNETSNIAYLAQHDLFAQIPSLRKDIAIPDICYTDAPDAPVESTKKTKKLDEPLINAWFGPAGTISPLHTDPYHNILCQVVGQKYVRLYAPSETKSLEPKGMENGVDMSNTSAIPVEVVEMGALGADDDDEDRWETFQNANYVETVLSEGDSLYIPVGWWHYVRSLSVSCSVSFWWN